MYDELFDMVHCLAFLLLVFLGGGLFVLEVHYEFGLLPSFGALIVALIIAINYLWALDDSETNTVCKIIIMVILVLFLSIYLGSYHLTDIATLMVGFLMYYALFRYIYVQKQQRLSRNIKFWSKGFSLSISFLAGFGIYFHYLIYHS